jgi:outer membrane protein OmpA-like peptidoglycan-associated protein
MNRILPAMPAPGGVFVVVGLTLATATGLARPADFSGAQPGRASTESTAVSPVDAAAMAAEVYRSGSVIVYGIEFEAGAAALPSVALPVLSEIRKMLVEHSDWRFEVQAHTSEAGGKAANLALSKARARAVVSWLTHNGIDESRLVAEGYGDTEPLAPDAAGAAAKNRRIELKKLYEEQGTP